MVVVEQSANERRWEDGCAQSLAEVGVRHERQSAHRLSVDLTVNGRRRADEETKQARCSWIDAQKSERERESQLLSE